ncbi:hypothetical protein [Granulibacter bethesdensis]|uniref:hypothetical protein n=1 Tax=Granulibacter bethesdensis TaxID=364410 RepID=UPI000933FE72|nr:hypothetical protein [Granulibacter bethesdensis]
MQTDHISTSLGFQPLLPLWLLGALGVLCLLALLPALMRRARGWSWRLAAFAALLIWLGGPMLVRETRQGLADIALLVIDQSGSMALKDRTKLAEQARSILTRTIPQPGRAGEPPLELRTVTVPEHGRDGTKLFAAIAQGLADIPRDRLAGIVAVTDGQVHDVPPSIAKGTPPAFNAPLHVLLTGRGEETDRRLRMIEAPTYGIVGKTVSLRVAVEDLGVANPAPGATPVAELTLRRDGEAPVKYTVPIGQEYPITLPVTHEGPSVIDMTAATLPGEVSTINNHAVVTLNGVRDRLRVLLVSGEPHQGERAWRRLLKADPSVDLVHFTILRPPEKDDNTPLNELALIAFPVRELFQQKIRDFDLIILDRFQNRGILPQIYLRNIADYVREGGALLMTAGPEYASPVSLASSPLGAVLPAMPHGQESDDPLSAVIEGGFRPQVTPLGTHHPVTEKLPGAPGGGKDTASEWGSWYRYIATDSLDNPGHGQTVLATPDGAPLLILDHVGKGRVALLLSDQIWLWSRGHQGGGPQAELLRRVAHWAMKQPELEEHALTAQITQGRLTARLRSPEDIPPGTVTVTDPDGKDTSVPLHITGPGRAEASLPAAAPGVWRVRYRPPLSAKPASQEGDTAASSELTAFVAASPPDPVEVADLRATATVLNGAARLSGGSMHWLSPAGVPAIRRVSMGARASGNGWIGLRRNDAHLVTGIDALPLLPSWIALPLILSLILAAWRREGR